MVIGRTKSWATIPVNLPNALVALTEYVAASGNWALNMGNAKSVPPIKSLPFSCHW